MALAFLYSYFLQWTAKYTRKMQTEYFFLHGRMADMAVTWAPKLDRQNHRDYIRRCV